jgi:subfamily B ATP-binding cassette protein MsbA
MQSEPQTGWSEFKQLFAKPVANHRSLALKALFALLGLAAAQGLLLLVLKGFLNALFLDVDQGQVSLSQLLPENLLKLWPQAQLLIIPRESLVLYVPILVCFAAITKALFTWTWQICQQELAVRVVGDLRRTLIQAVLSQPWTDFIRLPAGAWMSRIMNDMMFLQQRFTDILASFVRGSVMVAASIIMMFVIHWPTALILVMLSPVIAISMGRTGRRISRFSERFQRELAALSATVLDMRERFELIRSQRAEKVEVQRFDAVNRRYFTALRKSLAVRSLFAPGLEFFGTMIFALLVWSVGSGFLGISGDLLLLFFAALGLIIKPLREIGEQTARFQETRGVFREVLGTLQRIKTHTEALNIHGKASETHRRSKVDEVQLDLVRVDFSSRTVFSGNNLNLSRGKAFALIGPSGAGKSSFLKVCGGLVRPAVWDSDTAWEDLTPHVSMVSQQPFLFSGTVRENLLYGLGSDHGVSDEELWISLRAVSLEGFVRGLGGLDASVASSIMGAFSGGQVQRMTIARALLRRSTFLVLDEATSALDGPTEAAILDALLARVSRGDFGLLLVTHRLHRLERFDEILFAENGSLMARGRHAELLQRVDRYREFCAAAGQA